MLIHGKIVIFILRIFNTSTTSIISRLCWFRIFAFGVPTRKRNLIFVFSRFCSSSACMHCYGKGIKTAQHYPKNFLPSQTGHKSAASISHPFRMAENVAIMPLVIKWNFLGNNLIISNVIWVLKMSLLFSPQQCSRAPAHARPRPTMRHLLVVIISYHSLNCIPRSFVGFAFISLPEQT